MKNYTTQQLKEQLRSGAYAWPGGYPLYFVTSDCEVLSFETVRKEIKQVLWSIRNKDNTGGWRVIGVDVNYEDPELFCDHSGKRIESAYAEDEVLAS
jgi:hypothetical protein